MTSLHATDNNQFLWSTINLQVHVRYQSHAPFSQKIVVFFKLPVFLIVKICTIHMYKNGASKIANVRLL